MRHVTFARAMPPFGAGDRRLVPDGVAEQLERDGLLAANEPWPAVADRAPEKPVRPMLRPTRPSGGRDQRQAK